RRRALLEASLDHQPLREYDRPAVLVKRLIASMTPIVQEISAHSLAPDELVLRRMLGDNRREEIFVSKSELRRKLEPLTATQRSLFDSLGLGNGAAQPMSSQPPRSSVGTIVAGTIEGESATKRSS